jgi:hypothetical protein
MQQTVEYQSAQVDGRNRQMWINMAHFTVYPSISYFVLLSRQSFKVLLRRHDRLLLS